MKFGILSLAASLMMVGPTLGAKLRNQQRGVAFYLLFPRDKVRPVDPGDKTIEFVTRISDQRISRKFKLKDMMLEGKLAF